VVLSIVLGLLSPAGAVSVACVFGDNMVLQQERPVPVWGTAAPNEDISVAFGGQTVKARADAAGKWRATLAAMKANDQPQEMTITGKDGVKILKNVLVGEVWLCSGQSNMYWVLANALNGEAEVKAADFPAIRAFTAELPKASPLATGEMYDLKPQESCKGVWKVCSPESVPRLSAVAYFFARELHRTLKVPVGVIVASFGATAIEAWISLDGLKAVPCYRERAERFEEAAHAYLADTNGYAQAKAGMEKTYVERRRAWFDKLDAEDPGLQQKWMDPARSTNGWGTVSLPVTAADNPLGSPVASIWFRKEIAIPQDWVGKDLELHLGVIDGADEAYVNGTRVGRLWFDAPRYWEVSRVYRCRPRPSAPRA